MRSIFIPYLFSVTLAISSVNTHTKDALDPEIKSLIQEIKTSSGDRKRKAVNQLKLKLRSLNRSARNQTILLLQKNMHSQSIRHHTIPRQIQVTHHSSLPLRQGHTSPAKPVQIPIRGGGPH